MEDGSEAMQALESHGIATTYEDSNVVAATGQTLRAYGDAAIRAMLGKGLLLDANAALVLMERGFGPDIGLKSAGKPVNIDTLGAFSAEEFTYRPFGGHDRDYLTLTIPGLGGRPGLSVMKPAPGAQVASWIVDPDARRHYPCMIVFRNRMGGRVVVHALDWAAAYGVAFNHTFRRRQLQGAVQWLAGGRVPLLVNGGVYPLAFRKDTEAFTLVGLFNLTLDAWPHVEFTLADRRKVRRIEVLDAAGTWRQTPDATVTRRGSCQVLRYRRVVPFDQPLMATIWWK